MQTQPLPEWLYDALPYLYAGAGALTLAQLPNGMGVFSGLTLLSASAVVWWLRSRFSRSWPHDLGPRGRPVAQPQRRPGAAPHDVIAWRSSFECGHPVIDAQHRRLFELGNDFVDAVGLHGTQDECVRRLSSLVQHIEDHFATEERLLGAAGYPLSQEHREEHSSLLAKAQRVSALFAAGQLPASEVVGFIVYNLVADHVVKEDLFALAGDPDFSQATWCRKQCW